MQCKDCQWCILQYVIHVTLMVAISMFLLQRQTRECPMDFVSCFQQCHWLTSLLCLVFSTMSAKVDQFVVLYLSSPFSAQLLWQNRDLQTSRHLLKRNCFPSELLNHIPLKSHSFEFITFLCLLISNWRFHKMHWRKSQSEEISLILLILSRSDQGKNCGPASKNCSRPRTTVKTRLWAELLHSITIKGAVCIFHGQCHRSFAKETVCKVASSPFLKISSHKEIQPSLF